MTLFEHAMLGVNGAFALGLDRRYGWRIVAFSGCLAALPDWDGLTVLFGLQWYAAAHRVWGHNLLVAGLVAMVVSALAWRFDWLGKTRRLLGKRWVVFAFPEEADVSNANQGFGGLRLWIAVGVLATASHLAADVAFSAGKSLPEWKVPLFWPFSDEGVAWPMVAWGDVGTTLILVVGMFAMVRLPRWRRGIASAALVGVLGYIFVRGMVLPVR